MKNLKDEINFLWSLSKKNSSRVLKIVLSSEKVMNLKCSFSRILTFITTFKVIRF